MTAHDVGGILQVIGIIAILYGIIKLVGFLFCVKMPWIKDEESVTKNDPQTLIKDKGLLLEELEFANFNTEQNQWLTMHRSCALPEHGKFGTSLYVIFQLSPNTMGFLNLSTLTPCRRVDLTNEDYIQIYLEYLKRESSEFSLVASLHNSKQIEVLETRYREHSNENEDSSGRRTYKKFKAILEVQASQHSFWSKQ